MESRPGARSGPSRGSRSPTRRSTPLDGADALAIVTEWQEFRSPDFAAIRARLKAPAIFDGRNLYDPADVARLGFEYFPIGRAADGGRR